MRYLILLHFLFSSNFQKSCIAQNNSRVEIFYQKPNFSRLIWVLGHFTDDTTQFNGPYFEYYDEKRKSIKTKGYYSMGKKDSIWTYYDKNGHCYESITFKSDKMEGYRIWYYQNQSIKVRFFMEDNRFSYIDSLSTLNIRNKIDLKKGQNLIAIPSKKKNEIEDSLFFENGYLTVHKEYRDKMLMRYSTYLMHKLMFSEEVIVQKRYKVVIIRTKYLSNNMISKLCIKNGIKYYEYFYDEDGVTKKHRLYKNNFEHWADFDF